MNLQPAIPEMVTEACTSISNRHKGLLEAERKFGPLMAAAWCTYHLRMNFMDRFGRARMKFFWNAARARSEGVFNAAIEEAV